MLCLSGLRDINTEAAFSSLADSLLSNLKKYTFLDSVKSSFLRLAATPELESSSGDVAVVQTSVSTPLEETRRLVPCEVASVKEAFPGVFVILDRFPCGNHTASLQSLAEIGALFPDAAALTQFHR